MIRIEYKILFELRIVHDYYLIDGTGRTGYALSPADLETLLQRKVRSGLYDMSKDFSLLLNKDDQKKLRDYHIRLINTPLGFYVAMQVESETDGSGNRRFLPYIAPPPGAYLTFGFLSMNPLVGNITEIHIGDSDGLIYYFSNTGTHEGNALASTIPYIISDGSQVYKMGALARGANGAIFQALEDNDGTVSNLWESIPGDGYVHQGDRLLSVNEDWYKAWQLGRDKPGGHPMGIMQFYFTPADPGLTIIGDDGYLVTQQDAGQARPVHPVFELRFLSRRTYWRYQQREGFAAGEIDSINTIMEDWLDFAGGKFVTKNPRYFANALTGFLPATPPFDPVYFTNPAPLYIKKEAGRLYSDVFFTKANPIPV